MIEESLFELIEPLLRETGFVQEDGEEFREPALDILRYYRRPVRMSWVPLLGRALAVLAVVRQPMDIALTEADQVRLLTRLAMAVNGRFPPWHGLVVGLTAVVVTPEPIGPGDDDILGKVLAGKLRRLRVVPFGLLRVNLGQEALAFALADSPDRLFPEPEQLADLLSEHLRRFVPLIPT